MCGFTISPGSATNTYPTNPVQQDLRFSANVQPSLSQCPVYNFNPNETLSCSTTVADGDMNMATPANSCSTNSGTAITGHAYYFGPGAG